MKSAFVIALAALLGACVSVLPDPAPASIIYTLRAGEVARGAAPAKPIVMSVATPTAPRSLSGADIVWRQSDAISFMERAVWDGAAPDLLQSLLVDVMDRRDSFRAVVRAGAGVRSDLEVRWDLQAFEVVETGGTLEARIAMTAHLVELRSRAVIAESRFNAHAPISERSGRAAASALERVATEAAVQIADWASAVAPQPSAASTSR